MTEWWQPLSWPPTPINREWKKGGEIPDERK